MRRARILATVIAAALPFSGARAAPPAGLDKIQHIVVIYLENHSFDNLFGFFPGADGLRGKKGWGSQVDANGRPYAMLPQPANTGAKPPTPDPDFPANLPNAPFPIDRYVPIDKKTPDLVHRFYQNQAQIDGGKNDKFALISDAKGLSMGYYDTQKTRLWDLAREFTLTDHFFMGAFGGSFLNHMWVVCACTPKFPNAPQELVARINSNGAMVKDGAVTPDDYAVNTLFSVFRPHPANIPRADLMPPLSNTTIGDRLSAKGISWAWYSGGWNEAMAGEAAKLGADQFQFHHQPFAYFADLGDGTAAKTEHLKDEADLDDTIARGNLPSVVFFKPVGVKNEHPGYATVASGDVHTADIIAKLRKSPLWRSTLIVVTYDENGGFWDHVAPPDERGGGDRWGPGSRIPTLVISPFAKKHYVDHTVYDTTAILRLIEERFGLEPLGGERSFTTDPTNDLRQALTIGEKNS